MALPGVPREFSHLIEENLFPLMDRAQVSLPATGPSFFIRTRGSSGGGAFFQGPGFYGESFPKFGKVASLPQGWGVDVILTPDRKLSDQKLEELKEFLRKGPWGEFIWSFEGEALEEIVARRMKEASLTLCLLGPPGGGVSCLLAGKGLLRGVLFWGE